MIAGIVTPGVGRWVYQFMANAISAACAADDRGRRNSPAPDDGLVGDIVQRERIHGTQLRPSRPTSAILR